MMAKFLHRSLLKWGGVPLWNAFRADEALGSKRQVLEAPDLSNIQVPRGKLSDAYLRNACLKNAYLGSADLSRANLEEADLSGATLESANLIGASLRGANLSSALLVESRLRYTDLTGANLAGAMFGATVFQEINLTETRGLDSCVHRGRSIVDLRTLELSKNVPLTFWRGCGLTDQLIDYLPSLTSNPLQFYSCFISYSSDDQEFAGRLHTDLQNRGVRCWFAPHDLAIGKKILDGIDEAIRMRDKLLLVLSESAISSEWVGDEVTTAFEEERRRDQTVLFPIRLDDTFMKTSEPWASKLRARNIGDFK